jgi:hypothetical protein
VPLIPSLQVRGLYRKERTDHGRQPALLHYSSACTYAYVLFIPARPRVLFRVAHASRVLVSASRRNGIPCSCTALSPLSPSRSPRPTPHNVSGISRSACSTRRVEFLLLHAPCSSLCPYQARQRKAIPN